MITYKGILPNTNPYDRNKLGNRITLSFHNQTIELKCEHIQ